jgi:hypothetical protein
MTEDASKPTIASRLKALENTEALLRHEVGRLIAPGSPIFHSDLFFIGAMRRTLSQSAGFRMLIDARNFPCAAGILRMQLDTAMRLHGLTLVADADAAAKELLLKGTRFDKLTDTQGQQLKDFYLHKALSQHWPWVSEVYQQASDFVHLSTRHFFSAIAEVGDNGKFSMFVGNADPPLPDEEYMEIITAFGETCMIIAQMLVQYLEQRQEGINARENEGGDKPET